MLTRRQIGSAALVAALASAAAEADAATAGHFLTSLGNQECALKVSGANLLLDDPSGSNAQCLPPEWTLAATPPPNEADGFADGMTSADSSGSAVAALVPLPAMLPLLFSGLAALGGLGFRRRSGEVVMTVADGA